MNERVITDLGGLKMLRVLASCTTMVAAAAKLGVQPAAVRARLKTLERYTQKRLVKRTTRSCQITEAGMALLQEYEGLLQRELTVTRELLHKTKAAPTAQFQKPGASYTLSLRCTDEGQWVALSNNPDLVAVAPGLTEALQKLAHGLQIS